MKRVRKSQSPQSLVEYISKKPNATWGDMRKDCRKATKECLKKALEDQGMLCAYCEQKLQLPTKDSSSSQVEHFHPKSDKTTDHNWGLDWQNMLAACNVGHELSKEEKEQYPKQVYLHCDASKRDYAGCLLNPLLIPAFPNLFLVAESTGYIKANKKTCSEVAIPGNTYETTFELVTHTIEILNLNCSLLAEARREYLKEASEHMEQVREMKYDSEQVIAVLGNYYFDNGFPEYFTSLRSLWGEKFDDYLKSIDYQG